MANEAEISIQMGHDALQKLQETLQSAYDTAKSQVVRDSLDARLDVIEALLTKLNQADMASRTSALGAAADATADALKRLDLLKARLQAIADDVGKATEVLDDVDKALSPLKSYFGI